MADASGRKITKIIKVGEEWTISWVQGTTKHKFTSNERPQPELVQELERLQPYAVAACDYIRNDCHHRCTVYGMAMDNKGDGNRRNAEIFVAVNMDNLGPNSKLKTPKKLADNSLDQAIKGRWDTNCVAQIDKVELQALAYVDGERSQQEIPLVEKETKKGKKNAKKDPDQAEIDV
jgi:hypothetical protein